MWQILSIDIHFVADCICSNTFSKNGSPAKCHIWFVLPSRMHSVNFFSHVPLIFWLHLYTFRRHPPPTPSTPPPHPNALQHYRRNLDMNMHNIMNQILSTPKCIIYYECLWWFSHIHRHSSPQFGVVVFSLIQSAARDSSPEVCCL